MARLADPEERIQQFLKRHVGAFDAPLVPLKGDASDRRYFRLQISPGQTALLAVYPDLESIQFEAYLKVDFLLGQVGVSTPEIQAQDRELKIMLLEDLGDTRLDHYLTESVWSKTRAWLDSAIDILVAIQSKGTCLVVPKSRPVKTAFTPELLHWELNHFVQYYLTLFRRAQLPAGLGEELLSLANEMGSYPHVLCHRDYQVRNLMVKDSSIYVIDFQDARLGPAVYDLVSLLKDSIHLQPDQVGQLVNVYQEKTGGTSTPVFLRQFEMVSLQRLLKALGTYGYQIHAKDKARYKTYLAGTLTRALWAARDLGCFPSIQVFLESEVQALKGS